jgi:hypothetical protein
MRAAVCLSVVATVLAAAGPVLAQQDAASGGKPKHAGRISKSAAAPEASGQGAYMGYCGQWFRCYTGIPLRCGDNTRPYQDIPDHTCFCVHDSCPQQ